jgi:hypothetical protein
VQRALLIVLVALSYVLLAGGPRWSLGALLAIAGAAFVASPRRALAFHGPWRPLDFALAAAAAGLLIQLVPLPAGVVAVLSPDAARVNAGLHVTTMVRGAPAWATLSINREATAAAFGAVVLGILSFWIARGVFGAGGSTRQFCRALAIIGAAAAVLALVQKSVLPHAVLFVLAPEERSANPFGAFVNRNHFAGWLLLVIGPVCGYLVAQLRTHPAQRGGWRLTLRHYLQSSAVLTTMAAVTVIGVLLATLSRSGLAGFGAAALTAWLIGRDRMKLERTSLAAGLGLAGAMVIIAVLFVDVDAWAERAGEFVSGERAGASRLNIWRETVPIVRDFWLVGTGGGTYSDAMTQYQESRLWVGSMQRWAHFNNAHSQYVQTAAEGGLLLAVPAIAAMTWLGILGRRSLRADKGEMFWVRTGAAAGLAGLAVQSIWEVSLVMPANAVMCGALAGLMLHQRAATATPGRTAGSGLPPPAPLKAR